MAQLPAMTVLEGLGIEICHRRAARLYNKFRHRHAAHRYSHRRHNVAERVHRVYLADSEIEATCIEEREGAMTNLSHDSAVGGPEMRTRSTRSRYHVAGLSEGKPQRSQKFEQECRSLGFGSYKFGKAERSAIEI